jgi:hypothetical protein
VKKEIDKQFIIPYIDQDINFWEKLSEKYGKHIREVYFPITDDFIGTGRPVQPEKFLSTFLESKIFPVSVLINPVILPLPVNKIADRVLKMLEYYILHCNLNEVTLTSLELANIIKNKIPELKLTASTLMEISSVQQLVSLGSIFDTLVPSNRILRELKSLKELRNFYSGRMRIMVNEACIPSCVYRTQHFFEMSDRNNMHPHSLCNDILKQHPWLRLTGSWVLPQHLYLFEGLFDEIKLSGRVSLQRPERYINVFDSYIFRHTLGPHEIGGGPASVNIPLKITADFYQYTLNCNKHCSACTICSEYWKENSVYNG